MDDLEVNPLFKAFLGKFRREFEIACQMSYLIAIPQSGSLEGVALDQFFANSHILMPSRLLKMHFNQLQVGNFDDIELDERRLICHSAHKKPAAGRAERAAPPPPPAMVARILAEEIGYNALSKEYRTILIDRPLVRPAPPLPAPLAETRLVRAANPFRTILAPLSPRSQLTAQAARKQRAQLLSGRALAHHDDCAKYLECISRPLTQELERDVQQFQTNYLVLAQYLEDAAGRARAIAARHADRFERALERNSAAPKWLCESIRRSIGLATESHVVHLLHGRLLAATRELHAREDALLSSHKFVLLASANLTLGELGAQRDFTDFAPSDELLQLLRRLPNLQSPIAMVSGLLQLMGLVGAALAQSVELKRLLGEGEGGARKPTPICSDDLIACLVFCIARARPNNLFSLVRYLELFGWSAAERDQAAYYLATLESAVEYVRHFAGARKQARSRAAQEVGQR